jgi:hypothetical protein
MLRLPLVLALVCGFAASFPALAGAQLHDPNYKPAEVDPIDIPPRRDPLRHAFDRPSDKGGFYLRGTFGIGFQSSHLGPSPWKDSYDSRSAFGFADAFTLDIGGMIAPWFALHLTAHAGMLWNGDLDEDYGLDDGVDVRIGAYGGGPGATFYMPYHFYTGLSAGVGIAHTQYRGYNEWTNPGFFMGLAVGNDLYAGRNFSCGLQLQFVYMFLPADQTEDEVRVRQFQFGFSFAYDSI